MNKKNTVSESLTTIMGNKSKMIQKYFLENKIPYMDVKAKSITVDDILVPKINQLKKEDN
jgi:hypothetical protein